jgi:type II secretory pathway pseudopilin PulG
MQPVQPQATASATPRPYAPQQTETKAVVSLVLGVLGIIFIFIFLIGIVFAVPAVIFGHLAKSSINKSRGRLSGEGMAMGGLIMGYISLAAIPVVLIIAAIAIPGLLRARVAANESAAASTVRTVNTAQVAYLTTYPRAGYARDLASMGPGSGDCRDQSYPTDQHACLLDSVLAHELCIGTNWCSKSGYQFAVIGICEENQPCSGYVTTAVPIKPGNTGDRSFCATSDAIVRVKRGTPPAAPITSADECAAWEPV